MTPFKKEPPYDECKGLLGHEPVFSILHCRYTVVLRISTVHPRVQQTFTTAPPLANCKLVTNTLTNFHDEKHCSYKQTTYCAVQVTNYTILLTKANYLTFKAQLLEVLSCIDDQLLFLNRHLVLQSWGFKLAIVIKLVFKIFQVDLLALSWRLAAEHPQTAANGTKTNQGHKHKHGQASGKWQLVELRTEAIILGLQINK